MARTVASIPFLRPSLCVLVFLCLSGQAAWGQQDAVDSAREALQKTRQPWYDVDHDRLRPVGDGDRAEQPERADWRLEAKRSWDWNWGFGNWGWLGEIIKVLAWGVLVALLAFLIYSLVQAYLNANPIRSNRTSPRAEQETVSDEERIENLPVELKAKKGDFLSIAASHYQAGNFGEAIVYLFSYRLLQLDRAGFIRLTKGKTNRQYLLELRQHVDLSRLTGQTIVAFEDVFFGKHDLTRDRFEGCWRNNDRFLELIKQANV